MTNAIALYVHWPFCKSLCPYCDFNSHVSEFIDQTRWRNALVQELSYYATTMPNRQLTSIFFGGGTPSLMAPETVSSLIKVAYDHWDVDQNLEISLEANPSSSDRSKFAAFRKAGVNRLSLGIQSLNEKTLRFLGRNHDVKEARAAMISAKRIFDRVSFDFIYAWPGQKELAWREELAMAIDLSTSHLSLYQLTIEPGTPFFKTDIPTVSQDLGAALFETTLKMTASAGLSAYEISNHSRPGYECRHNLTYWKGGDYIGIGPGAHSRLSDSMVFTAAHQIYNPVRWLNTVEEIGHGTGKRQQLNSRDKAEEMIMTGLRLTRGLDTSAIAAKTGLELTDLVNRSALTRFLKESLLEKKGRNLIATPAGWMVLNTLIGELLSETDVPS